MRLLVTGHLGYIGAVLTPMLIEAGHEVVGLDADLYASCTFGDPAQLAAVPTVQKDLRDVEPTDLEGFDAILHLAALSNDPLGDLDPGCDVQDQSTGLGEAGGAGTGCRRVAIPLLVVLQQLWCSRSEHCWTRTQISTP